MSLTGKQKRHLRSLAQTLKPVVHVGKNGLTDATIGEVTKALIRDELVKVKLQEAERAERASQADELAKRTGAEIAGLVGGALSLYLAPPPPEPGTTRRGGPKIKLPAAAETDEESGD